MTFKPGEHVAPSRVVVSERKGPSFARNTVYRSKVKDSKRVSSLVRRLTKEVR